MARSHEGAEAGSLSAIAVAALAAWFRDHGRPYHFRKNPTAYSVWILEVMSQQTQIARAEERHRRWLDRFPDIASLAAASEDEVLREWEGLGYYSRARNLRRAALEVMEGGGVMPLTRDGLLALPGIGDYTAASIASIVYGQAVPAVDANVRRVMTRFLGAEKPTTKNIALQLEQAFAFESAGVINEAMMELGEQLCRRRAPGCDRCPLAKWCIAGITGKTDLPRAGSGSGRVQLRMAVACISQEDEFFIEQAPEGQLWAGLWRLPSQTFEEDQEASLVVRELVESRGIAPRSLVALRGKFTGGHTRYTIKFFPYRVRCTQAERKRLQGLTADKASAWVSPSLDGGRTFPSIFRRILEAAASQS